MILEQRFNAKARGIDRQFVGVELPDRFEVEPDLYLSFELGSGTIVLIFELQIAHSNLSRIMATRYTMERDQQIEYPCVNVWQQPRPRTRRTRWSAGRAASTVVAALGDSSGGAACGAPIMGTTVGRSLRPLP
jgi:hypothetical protein